MSSDNPPLRVASAVYAGAVVLIGLPTAWLLSAAYRAALEALGWEWVLEHPGSLVVPAVAFVIGLQVAVEVTALKLYGLEALRRGSPRAVLARYLAIATCATAGLAAAIWVGLSTAIGGYGPAVTLVASLVVLAGVFALYRASSAFVAGIRSDDGERTNART